MNELKILEKLEPEDALRLWRLREMMDHRKITRQDIAKEIGSSEIWLRRVLTAAGETVTTPRRYARWLEWLSIIDSACYAITEARGGLQATCGCSDTALRDMKELLSHGN